MIVNNTKVDHICFFVFVFLVLLIRFKNTKLDYTYRRLCINRGGRIIRTQRKRIRPKGFRSRIRTRRIRSRKTHRSYRPVFPKQRSTV